MTTRFEAAEAAYMTAFRAFADEHLEDTAQGRMLLDVGGAHLAGLRGALAAADRYQQEHADA